MSNGFANNMSDKDIDQYTEREQIFIMMMKFGEGFVENLGHLYFHAGAENRFKLENTFKDYVEEYEKFLPKHHKKITVSGSNGGDSGGFIPR